MVAALALVLLGTWLSLPIDGLLRTSRELRVAHVVDGDTVVLANGETIRYLGIDAPETVHPEKPVECYGPESAQRNRELAEGKVVALESDTEDRDQYGRLLRYVYVDGTFVNGVLVSEGYAHAAAYGENLKHLRLLADLESEARKARRGLWGVCN